MKHSIPLSLTAFLILSLTACGGGGGGGGKKSPLQNNPVSSVSSAAQSSIDSEASSTANSSSTNSSSSISGSLPGELSLVSTTPENNAVGVDLTEALEMTFSATLANTPDPTSYVTLTKNVNSAVPFSASISNMTLWVTPSEKLALQTPYQVSVSTAVRGITDEQLEAASIVNFTTRDGIWGDALSISDSSDDTANATKPKIATDSNGNAVAIWQQIDDDETDLVTASYTAMSGWSDPVVIGSNIHSLTGGQIAMNANGQAIVAWANGGIVKASVYTSENGTGMWGNLNSLEELGVGNVGSIQVAVDSQGNAVVIWTKGLSNLQVWANRYTPEDGWDTAIQLDTVATGSPYPQIVMDSSGNALAIWNNENELLSSQYIVGSDWSTGWSTPNAIENRNASISHAPNLSINSSGNAALIWIEGTNIVTSLYSAESGWSITPAVLDTNDSSSSSAKIALDNKGNAIAVWSQGDAGVSSIWTSRYSAATSIWSTAELIETDSTGAAGDPQLAIDETGNAIVVWRQILSNNRYDLHASRYVNGGSWTEPSLIEVENFKSTESPHVAINKFGSVFAVWSQELINEPISIWANKFE